MSLSQSLLRTHALAAFLALLVSSCSGGGGGSTADNVAPSLSASNPTSPADGAQNVAVDAVIRVTFNEAIDPQSVGPASFALSDSSGPAVSGTFDVSGPTLTFTPTSPLAYDTAYQAQVLGGVTDRAGNPFGTTYSWSFRTAMEVGGGDIEPPVVVATSPTANATDVALDASVTVLFSEAIDPATVTAERFRLTLAGVAVPGTIMVDGAQLTLTPSALLEASTTYGAELGEAIADLAGNPLGEVVTWSFTTAAPVDIEPPTVVSNSPANGSQSAQPDTVVEITFSEPMNQASVLSGITLTDSDGVVPANVQIVGLVAFVEPMEDLQLGHEYTVTVPTSVTDLAGNGLVEEFRSVFSVVPVREGYWYKLRNGIMANDRALESAIVLPTSSGPADCSLRREDEDSVQYYRFEDIGGGLWRIVCEYHGSGRALYADLVNRDAVLSTSGGPGGEWRVVRADDDRVLLRNQAGGVAWNLTAISTSTGVDVALEQHSSFLDSQRWELHEVGPVGANFTGRASTREATSSSITLHTTRLFNDLLRDDPDALIFATARQSETSPIFNNAPIGVTYDGNGRHRILNSGGLLNIVPGTRFDVMLPADEFTTFVQDTPVNANWVRLSHPALNNNPDALIFVTARSPVGLPNAGNFPTVDIEYRQNENAYGIYCYSVADPGSRWNVLVVPPGPRAFRHVATGPTIFAGSMTRLNHPLLNGNPDAVVTVTKAYNTPGQIDPVANDNEVAVRYVNGFHHIVSLDTGAIIVDSKYNVLIGAGN